MQFSHFAKAALLMLFVVITFLAAWELYLRNKGVKVAYDDGKELWSYQRSHVYAPSDKATVFIGSSRIKFDLDVPTWEELTGEDAIQLAAQGSTPLPVLKDLAADENFKGKLVIDVTEGLFFSLNPRNATDPESYLGHYKDESPSEKASFELNKGLESQLVFLDKDNYSLNAFLNQLPLRNRPGVFQFPFFPMEFDRNTFDRQSKMMDVFLVDTNLQKKVTGNWMFFASLNKDRLLDGAKLDSFLTSVKDATDKIKARGGQIIFVRTPSSGPYWEGEQKTFPRGKYWDRLLSFTSNAGVHFKDYPEMADFICPEWSHLSPSDAITFTRSFVSALQEKGWTFSNRQTALR